MATWWSSWQEQNPYTTFAQKYGWTQEDHPFTAAEPIELFPQITGWIGNKYTTDDAWANWSGQFQDFDDVYNAYADANPSVWRLLTGGRESTDPNSVAYVERIILQSIWDAWRNSTTTPPPDDGGTPTGEGTPRPQPEGETVPEVTEWWREQGFESYEDWYDERWLPYVEALKALIAERPDMPDFSGIYGGIADLAGQIANPSATWGAEADAFTARMLGFESPGAYQTWLQEQRGKTTEDFRMSPEQRAALEKEQRSSERQIAEQGRLRAEAAFGASGGMLAKMSQAMDEANATIYDERARFQADLIATDFANAIAQLQANNDYMMRSIEQGTATYGQYIQMQEQGAAAALQNYYNQAALMLDEYEAEWQGILNQAKLIADAAALAMGTEETILALINQRYEQSLASFVDAQTFEINEATLEQIYAAIDQGNWELLVQLITGVLAGIGDIIPG